MAKKTTVRLYLNSARDYSIVDDSGKKYTLAEAKALVNAGRVDDCNYSFQRLVNFDWDLDRVKRFYEGGAAR